MKRMGFMGLSGLLVLSLIGIVCAGQGNQGEFALRSCESEDCIGSQTRNSGFEGVSPYGGNGTLMLAEGDLMRHRGPGFFNDTEGVGPDVDEALMTELHTAVVSGDWDQYSSLVSELGLTQGLHGLMTEEAFELFSHIAQLHVEINELRQQLAEELGLEELPGSGGRGPRSWALGVEE